MGHNLEQSGPRAEVSVHMGELSSARQAFEQSSAGPAGHTVCVIELVVDVVCLMLVLSALVVLLVVFIQFS